MLFHRARSELQISESAPSLPRTTYSRRLSSTISGLLFVGVSDSEEGSFFICHYHEVVILPV
jgi:hypothetical protein